jgi:hypothetical protein
MALFLFFMGGIAYLVGFVWIMINAFSESVPWGVGCLLCSPVALIYGFLKWEELKLPAILMGIGALVGIAGRILGEM